MSDDEPTVIIPTGHCWLAHAHRDHPPHLYGNPPNTRRCPGQATKDEDMSIQPDMDALNAARILDGIKRMARAGRLVYKLEAQGDQPVKPSDIIRTAEKEPK